MKKERGMTAPDTAVDPLREALNEVVTKSTWRPDNTVLIHDGTAWNTLVGRIVIATNGEAALLPPDDELVRLRAIEAAARNALGRGDTFRGREELAALLSNPPTPDSPETATCVCGASPPTRPWNSNDPCRDGNGNFRPGHGYAAPTPDSSEGAPE